MVWSIGRVIGGCLVDAKPILNKDESKLFVTHGSNIRVYDIMTCKLETTLVGHKDRILGCFLNPFSDYQLYSYSCDGEIRLWDLQDFGCVKVMRIPTALTYLDMVAHPTEPNVLYSAIVYKMNENEKWWKVVQYNTQTNQIDRVIVSHSGHEVHLATRAIDVSFSYQPDLMYSNGCYLVISHSKVVFLYNSTTNTLVMCNHVILTITNHLQQYEIHGVAIHPTKEYFITSDSKGRIDQWYVLSENETPSSITQDISRGNEQGVLMESIEAMKKSPLKTIEISHPKMAATLHWHAHSLSNIQFSQATGQLYSGGEEGVMVIWSENSLKPGFIPRVAPRINAFTVSADGTRLFVACNDNAIRFIEVSQRTIVATLSGLAIGSVLPTKSLHPFIRAGMLYDARKQCILLNTPSSRGYIQYYNPERDEGAGLIGEFRQEVSKTDHQDNKGSNKIDHMCLSMNYEWLFVIQRWANQEGNGTMSLMFYKRNEKNEWPLFAQIDNPHAETILAMSVHPCKNEVITTDGTGLVKTWSFVEKQSALNNNEAVSYDALYTWSCTHQHIYNEEGIRSIHYSYDGSILALSHGRSITLWNTVTHSLLDVLPTPPPKSIIRSLSFFPTNSLLLTVTDDSVYVWDIITRQIIWMIALTIRCSASNARLHPEVPYVAIAVKNQQAENHDTVLIFKPESQVPVASITLTTKVHAMCWGKTSIQEGRQMCLFCLTEKREIIQIVEGEVKTPANSTQPDETPVISAFDEVFEVDKVEERANSLRQESDYNDLLKSKEFYGLLNGSTHTLPPPSVLFQSLFDKITENK